MPYGNFLSFSIIFSLFVGIHLIKYYSKNLQGNGKAQNYTKITIKKIKPK
jgi:hypothetical protein